MQKTQRAVIQLTPAITVDVKSRDSIADAVSALVKMGEIPAATAFMGEVKGLYAEGVVSQVILVMDVSGSMDNAGNIGRIHQQLPKMLQPAAGDIPVKVSVRVVTFGDLNFGDKIWAQDFRTLEEVTRYRFSRESGGCPFHESHLEALTLSVGINLLREGELRSGSERLSPLPESGTEIILVTDDEGPRTNRITVKKTRKKLPTNCRLTVVASNRETWKDLLRKGDRFVLLGGNLSGLLRPVQDAIGDAMVRQVASTVALIAGRIQNKVAGLLTTGGR